MTMFENTDQQRFDDAPAAMRRSHGWLTGPDFAAQRTPPWDPLQGAALPWAGNIPDPLAAPPPSVKHPQPGEMPHLGRGPLGSRLRRLWDHLSGLHDPIADPVESPADAGPTEAVAALPVEPAVTPTEEAQEPLGPTQSAAGATTPEAANAALALGEEALRLLRRTLGLPWRGSADAALSRAILSLQVTHGLAATGVLDRDTLFAMPFAPPRGAADWYRSRRSPWATMREDEREEALGAVRRNLGLDEQDFGWEQGMQVSQLALTRAMAWQIWQRLGLSPDARLGLASLVAMGVHVQGGSRVVLNLGNASGSSAASGVTFAERVSRALGGGGHFADLRGEDDPRLGPAAAQPEHFLRVAWARDPQAVRLAFFPDDAAAQTLEEILRLLRITPGQTCLLSTLITSEGLPGLRRLVTSELGAEVQQALLSEQMRPLADAVTTAGHQVSCGTAALAVLVGQSSQQFPDDEAAQSALARDFVESALGTDPILALAGGRYLDALLQWARGEAPEPNPGQFLEQAANQTGMLISPPWPARFSRLHDFVAALRDIWRAPYTGADAVPAAGGSSFTTVNTADARPTLVAENTRFIEDARQGGRGLAEKYAGAAQRSALIRELGATWDEFMNEMTTMRFLGQQVTGHPIFLTRLARAEAWLGGQERCRGMEPSQIARALGVRVGTSARAQLRTITGGAVNSYHHLGFALDIDPMDNPWFGNWGAAMVAAFVHASWRATWLLGRGTPLTPAGLHQMAEAHESTEAIYEAVHASNQALSDYLTLAEDLPGIATHLINLRSAPPPQVPDSTRRGRAARYQPLPEDEIRRLREADAAAWRQQIQSDKDRLGERHRSVLSHDELLVIALRDHGGLAWGGCDLGPRDSGDFMHFDGRRIQHAKALHDALRA